MTAIATISIDCPASGSFSCRITTQPSPFQEITLVDGSRMVLNAPRILSAYNVEITSCTGEKIEIRQTQSMELILKICSLQKDAENYDEPEQGIIEPVRTTKLRRGYGNPDRHVADERTQSVSTTYA
jgi:hypothetical protein